MSEYTTPADAMGGDSIPGIHQFRSLEEAFRNPEAVWSLDLLRMDLEQLPEDMGRFSNLLHLNVARNKLSSLPDAIAGLKKLRYLDITGNRFEVLPDRLYSLESLRQLYAGKNRIKRVEGLGQLTGLVYLKLSENRLESLPAGLGALENLHYLYLSKNRLESLPEGIGRMQKLEVLDVSENKLSSLPQDILECRRLRALNAGNNVLADTTFVEALIPRAESFSGLKIDLSRNPYLCPQTRTTGGIAELAEKFLYLPGEIRIIYR